MPPYTDGTPATHPPRRYLASYRQPSARELKEFWKPLVEGCGKNGEIKLPAGFIVLRRVETLEREEPWYIFGHPKGWKYRSAQEFIPHYRWLLEDPTHDHRNCTCRPCVETYRSKGRVETEEDRRTETKRSGGGDDSAVRVRSHETQPKGDDRGAVAHSPIKNSTPENRGGRGRNALSSSPVLKTPVKETTRLHPFYHLYKPPHLDDHSPPPHSRVPAPMFRDGDIVWVRVVLDVLYGSATITLEPHASARVLKLEGLNGPGDLPYWPAMVQQTLSGDADSVGVRMKVAVPPFWVTSEVKETGKARCHIYIERTHRAFTADAGYHAYKLRLLGGVDISVDVMERFIQPFVAFKPPASQILAPEVIDEVEKVTEEPVLRCYLSAVAQAVGYISSTMIAGDNDSLRLGAERIMVGDTVRVRRRSKEGEAERDARDGCAWDLMDVRRIEWLMSADVLADVLVWGYRVAPMPLPISPLKRIRVCSPDRGIPLTHVDGDLAVVGIGDILGRFYPRLGWRDLGRAGNEKAVVRAER